MSEDLADGLEELEVETSDSIAGVAQFIYQNQSFPFLRSGEKLQVRLDDFGNEVLVGFTAHVRRSLFVVDQTQPTGSGSIPPVDHWPVSGDLINYNNRDYKVISAMEDSTRAFIVLELRDPNSNQ